MHVEVVCKLRNRKYKPDSSIDLTVDMEKYYRMKEKETRQAKGVSRSVTPFRKDEE